MGYKDFTQRSQENIEESNNAKEKIVIKSQLLQQLRQIVIFLYSRNCFLIRTSADFKNYIIIFKENTLWDRTKLILTENIFYVKQLSPQITPLEKKEQKTNVN